MTQDDGGSAVTNDEHSPATKFDGLVFARTTWRLRVLDAVGLLVGVASVSPLVAIYFSVQVTLSGWWLFLLMSLSFSILLLAQRARRLSVVVGADGIQLDGYGTHVFYRHAEIAGVELQPRGVDLRLHGGEIIKLVLPVEGVRRVPLSLPHRLYWRIMDARVASQETSVDGEATATQLARRGRSARAWLDFLRREGAGAEEGFRTAPASREALLATLENPAARAVDRFAAAVSLAKDLTPAESPRVRVAIEACADAKVASRLRIAVEPPSDEALEEALLEAEADDSPQPGPQRAS